MRVTRATIAAICLAAAGAGCSLTTGGFHECDTDADCPKDRICQQNFCVVNPIPEGCGRTEGAVDATNAIHIGATLPITSNGHEDQSEVQGLNSILLAVEELNQREGIGGRLFALHVCDSGGDSERVKQHAAWLADEKGAVAILTSGSGQTLAASTETVRRNVVVMTATATSPELTVLPDTNGGPVGLVWRTAPSDAIQGSVIVDLLANDAEFAGVDRVGIVYVKDPYGDGLAAVLLSELGKTPKSVSAFSYERGGDIAQVVSQLDAFDPDLTVLVAFPDDGVRILQAANTSTNLSTAAGHRWFFSDSAKDPALIAGAAPGQIEGALGTAPAQAAGIVFDVFASSFRSRFGIDPEQFSYTAHSYDAMYLLALGAQWAVGDGSGELTGPRIAEGLTRLSSGAKHPLTPSGLTGAKAALQAGMSIDVDGASGPLDFDPASGEAPGRIEIWRIEGNGFITDRVVDPP